MNFFRLKNFSNEKTEKLKNILLSLNLTNIFNPCYKEYKKNHYICFRADSEFKYKHPDSYIIILDENYQIITLQKLNNLYNKKYGIHKVFDPKFCELNDAIFLTFNTGPNVNGNNFYLAEINKDFPRPKKCIYEERMLMEKNWAFYNFNDKLMAIYSLKPLITLEASVIKKDKKIGRAHV